MLAFRNGSKIRNSDSQLLKGDIFAIFFAILVKIGPLTPEIMQGLSVTFAKRRQKSRDHTKYSTSTGPNFTHISGLIDTCMGIIKLT